MCAGLFGLGEYEQEVLTVLLIMVPAALYIMGLMEGKRGNYFFFAGLALHALSILYRGLALGRLPLAEKHDNISFMAFSMALTYLYLRPKSSKSFPLVALPLITAFLFVALGFRPIDTISPFMDSPWFYLHIFFHFTAYGFMGVSSAIGAFYITGSEKEQETLQYRAAAWGWVLLSISLLAGSVWFYMAYGTYWLWTSREMWITITWLYYGLYLHARLMKGLRGRPAAVLGALGFAVALFAYFGVGTVIKSPPTQF